MLDIGWSELFVIGVVALIVVGPKDLPRALGTMGRWVARLRAMVREFQSGVDAAVREAELQDLREKVGRIDMERALDHAVDRLAGEDAADAADTADRAKTVKPPTATPAAPIQPPPAETPATTPADKPASTGTGASS